MAERFFFFCAGANQEILAQEDCSTERPKYVSIGGAVLLTSVLAVLSGGYAMFTIFNNGALSVVFGLVWGAGIFNLDRSFIVNLKKSNASLIPQQTGSSLNQVAQKALQLLNLPLQILKALPRLTIAVLLGLVITKPIEMKIFEREINTAIAIENQSKANEEKQKLLNEDVELQKLESDLEELQKELASLEAQEDKAYKEFICEAEGRCGTGKLGRGPVADEKEKRYEELKIQVKQKREEIDTFKKNIDRVKNKVNQKYKQVEATRTESGSLLTRLKALEDLSKKDETIGTINTFITLIFITLETAPILVKIMSKYGPYDAIVESKEGVVIYEKLAVYDRTKQKSIKGQDKGKKIQEKDDKLLNIAIQAEIKAAQKKAANEVIFAVDSHKTTRKDYYDYVNKCFREILEEIDWIEIKMQVKERINQQIKAGVLKSSEGVTEIAEDKLKNLQKEWVEEFYKNFDSIQTNVFENARNASEQIHEVQNGVIEQMENYGQK